jgi:hypothetical protein
MPITSQAANFFFAGDLDDPFSASVTIQVPNATTLAEISLFRIELSDESHYSATGRISQIVSASGVENFAFPGESPVPIVFRQRVTSINFAIYVVNALAGVRWMLHFYT